MANRRGYIRKTKDLGGGRKLITYEPAEGLFGSFLGAVFIGLPILLINFAWMILYYTFKILLWIFQTLLNIVIFTVNRMTVHGEKHGWWAAALTLLFWLALYALAVFLIVEIVKWYLEYAANYEG